MTPPAETLALALPGATAAPAMPLPERLDDEPAKWHARLCAYCLCGPSRTVDETWRQEQATGGHKGQRPPGSWRRAVERWNWTSRAAVHDAATLAAEAREAGERRRLERERRRDFAARLLNRVQALVDDPHVFREIPASVGLAASRAHAIHQSEFGADPTEEQIEDAALLLPASAPGPVVNIIVQGNIEKDELPPPGVVAEESDGA